MQGLPFFTAGDRPDAGVTLLLPEQDEGGASAEEVLARSMSPPHFPIRPGQLRGRWSFGTAGPGELEVAGFSVEAGRDPAQGRTDLGLPGQRRALDARLHP